MLRSKQRASNQSREHPTRRRWTRRNGEAVAGVRDALARVIADGSHSDRSLAIESIRAVDRG